MVIERQQKNAAPRTTIDERAERCCSGFAVKRDAEQQREHEHDDGLRQRPDARRERLAA